MEMRKNQLRYTGIAAGFVMAIGLFVLIIQMSVSAAPAQMVWYVHPDGQDTNTGTLGLPFATIQYAIGTASDGDTILVAAGTYTENLVITENLTLRGGYTVSGTQWLSGSVETVVNGDRADRVVFVHDGDAVLERLTITGGQTPDSACWGGGVSVTNGAVTIRSSKIIDNRADSGGCGAGGGLDANNDWGPASLAVIDSIIAGNHARDHGGAVNTLGVTAYLTNVLIVDNAAAAANVLTVNESNVTIQNSTISDNNPEGGQAVLLWSGGLTITNSILWNNGLNVQEDPPCPGCVVVRYSDVEGGWPDEGNIDAEPEFVDPPGGDYHLQAWSPCIDAGVADGAPDHDYDGDARPQNAGYDMGFDEFVGTPLQNEGARYVATDGSDDDSNPCLDPGAPCSSITRALDLANAGESILVAQGTYTENLTVSKPVTLSGGYARSGDLWLPGGETILDRSGSHTIPGDWDGLAVRKPAVISDGIEYKMWYGGVDLFGQAQVGLASSTDGLSWIKQATNPVFTGTQEAWDGSIGERAPFVLKEDGVYKMWYEGTNVQSVRQLGYATSTNGIDWVPYPSNPVLEAGPDGFDQEAAGHGSVLNDGGTYKLWYHAMGDQGPIIAYATSPDGENWTKHGPALLPESGSWDENGLWGPSVLLRDGTYWMWYAAAGAQGPPAIGVVTSTDGLVWSHFVDGPVLTETTSIGDPHVIDDGGKLKMWYQDFEQGVIGYAESDDGLQWTKSASNPVLTPGAPPQWAGPVVRFEQGSDGAVLEGFTITGGDDDLAGGVDARDASVTIRNTLIRDNFANGMPDHAGGAGVLGGDGETQLTLVDSRIVNNRANGGAGGVRVYHQGSLVMINTLVADNVGAPGIHVNGPLELWQTTVANNDGGVTFNPLEGTVMTATNSILYGNGSNLEDAVSGAAVTYSDIEGSWPGAGNIDADPRFTDPANGDYHLQAGSPAIDAGTPAGAPPADLDGAARDAAPDIGVYEFMRFDHDVAVVDVLPGGAVEVNVPFLVRATVYNIGNLSATNVPVVCDVEYDGTSVYQETANSGVIQPLHWEVLEFSSYTPTEEGSYSLTCQSTLSGDERPANDLFTTTLSVVAGIPDVWTRDNPADDGDTPSGLDDWYESPDIWVRTVDDGGLVHQDPVAGITNTVYVRLRNRGTMAISGTVDVSWIEPSLGVRCGDWAPIGSIAFVDLIPGEARILSLPWAPTRTGHTCLQDVIDSPQDPYNRKLACAPQWVPMDNNVGWRNVNIVANPETGLQGALDVKQATVQLVNVYNLPQDVDLVIQRSDFPITGTVSVYLPGDLFDRWQAHGSGWGAGIEVLPGARQINVTSVVSGIIGAIPMHAAEKAELGLSFDGPAGSDFGTSVQERIDGTTVGGVRYEWTIPDTTPPQVLAVSPANGATQVSLDAPLVIAFTEEIGPLSLDLSLAPDPGGWRTSWNEAGTVVTATHAGLSAETSYVATVTASDAAANPMSGLSSWSFSSGTEGEWVYLPIVLR